MTLVTTIEDKTKTYSNIQCTYDVLARIIRETMGHLFLEVFFNMIDNNLPKKYQVSRNDIMVAQELFKPDLGGLKGKTTRTRNKHVQNIPVNTSVLS